jgi:hypothetical protein
MTARAVAGAMALVLGAACSATGGTSTLLMRPNALLGSQIAPQAKRRDLLYVSNGGSDAVTVYSYPDGEYLGALYGFDTPYGQCTDKHGDVFITDFNGAKILEYAHGGSTPEAVLVDSDEHPAGCSIDPINGDLAVSNSYTLGYEAGSISIYPNDGRNGFGAPRTYSDSKFFHLYFCGYDNRGDLFVDGLSGRSNDFEFAELPAGGKSFTAIKLKVRIQSPGGVQWDGRYVTVGDAGSAPSMIYQFDIRGSVGVKEGATPLRDTSYVTQYFIDGSTIVGPAPSISVVGFWSYPAGGAPSRTIGDGLDDPTGLTISRAQR